MRKIIIVAPVVAGALLLLSAGPASAADTGTTFQIVGGTLAISAPVGPVSLGTKAPTAAPETITSPLGNVTVTDGRGGVLGWVASVASTAFTGATAVPASAISYVPPVATVTGVALVAATPATDLTTAKTVQTATVVVGANSAVWNPALAVVVPAGAQAGTYNAVVTHSVI
jgi:hypothetical protein